MPCNLIEDREFSLFKLAFLELAHCSNFVPSAGTSTVSVHVERMNEVDVKKVV